MTISRTASMAALALLTVSAAALFGQDPPPVPAPQPAEKGAAVKARAAADAEKLLPQRGLGGDASASVAPNATTFSEFKIDEPGCEKMTGYLSKPADLEPGKKYALMFMFHGNGDPGAGRVRNVSAITTKRDPIFVAGVQYQELTPDGHGKMGLPQLASAATILKGCQWLLAKLIKEQPIDPARVFVGGFSWGTSWASQWCNLEWSERPDQFPFRACFLYSSGGAGTKATVPPIPIICFVGENETAAKGNYEVLPGMRRYSNTIAAWGVPMQHHEIPNLGHQVGGRCLQITRDIINDLGGPGAVPYKPAPTTDKPEPLPFEAGADAYVKEVAVLGAEDKWADALARIKEIDKDRKVKPADKKAVLALTKVIDTWARKELPRLDASIGKAITEEKFPSEFQVRRQKALLAVYGKEYWAQGKGYAETLAKLNENFPPLVRERERAAAMKSALALERAGQRADAKAAYEKLAARKDEDPTINVWSGAAAYRLSWWIDG